MISSPYREDKNPSCSISLISGRWKDFATNEGGDWITLYARTKGISDHEAATEIAEMYGAAESRPSDAAPVRPSRTDSTDRPPPVIPIPPSAPPVESEARKVYFETEYGEFQTKYLYIDTDGSPAFYVCRYAGGGRSQRKKNYIPFYWNGGRWIARRPPLNEFPLFRRTPDPAEKVCDDTIIVEGEQCVEAACRMGYDAVSWMGGSSAGCVNSARWEALRGIGSVTLWPDNDVPGKAAMDRVGDILADMSIRLSIVGIPSGKPRAWDIADADPQEAASLISGARIYIPPPAETPPDSGAAAHAPDWPGLQTLVSDQIPAELRELLPRCLGWSEDCLYVWHRRMKRIIEIKTSEKAIAQELGHLAHISVWGRIFPSSRGGIDERRAVTYIREMCEKAGIFDPADSVRVKGAGPHRDGSRIIINTGDGLIIGGEKKDYGDYAGRSIMCASSRRFRVPDAKWSPDEADDFINHLSSFQLPSMPLSGSGLATAAAAGWAAMAPWAALLEWRPHLWISGAAGSGKTTLMKVIRDCIGSGHIYTEGTASEAYLRQRIGSDTLPVLIDEFDERPDRRGAAEQDKVIQTIRSCSSGTEIGRGTARHSPVIFAANSAFCLASVQTRLKSEADQSRFVRIEIGRRVDPSCRDYAWGTGYDGLRGLIYSRLEEILKSIPGFRRRLIGSGNSERTADLWAPIFSFYWPLRCGEAADSGTDEAVSRHQDFRKMYDDLAIFGNDDLREPDEDRTLGLVLSKKFKISPSQERTVGEGVRQLAGFPPGSPLPDTERMLDADMRRGGGVFLLSPQMIARHLQPLPAGAPPHVIIGVASKGDLSKFMAENGAPDYIRVLRRHWAAAKCSGGNLPVGKISGVSQRYIPLDWTRIIHAWGEDGQE